MHIVLLIIALLFLQNSYSQVIDSVTDNLVNTSPTPTMSTSTWQGVGLFNGGLPCWTPEDEKKGAYCGPNAYVNGGNINFSYGLSDVHQYVNVAKSLPYSGAGLVTTGFRFGWMSKNGNGWEATTNQDILSTYVQLYDKGNKVVENFYWNLNYIHDWTTFSYDKNWSKLYRPKDISNVKFGFVGSDTSYWAGPYGPEVTNINFQLKYKPDPCVKNQLYSPECPKFSEELAQRTGTSTTTNTEVKSTETITLYDQGQPISKTTENKNFDSKEEIYEEGVYSEEFFNVDYNKLVDTLFKIQDNQSKEEKITLDSSKTAILETERISQQTVKQAEQIAARAVKQSIEGKLEQHDSQDLLQKDNKGQLSITLFQAPTVVSLGSFQIPGMQQKNFISQLPTPNIQATTEIHSEQQLVKAQQTYSLATVNTPIVETISISTTINVYTPPVVQNNTVTTQNTSSLNLLLPNQINESILSNTNFLTNKTDPINSIIENKNIIEERKEDVQTTSVKKNVKDNDLADSGTTLSQIATIPAGYNAYTNLIIRDVAFYEPKEIYRNQKTVDNVRALRQLASDRLHQELVNQQYRR